MAHSFQINGSSFPNWWFILSRLIALLSRLMAHLFQIDYSSFPDSWLILSILMAHPFPIDGSSFSDWWLILSRLMAHPFQIHNSSFPGWLLIFSTVFKLMAHRFKIDCSSFPDKYILPTCSIVPCSIHPPFLTDAPLMSSFLSVRRNLSCPGPETAREAVGFILAELLGENGLPGMETLLDIKRKCCFHYCIKLHLQYNLSLLTCTEHPSPVVHFVSWQLYI